MDVVLFALLAVILIYFIVALSPIKICAICASVSLTWLGLLLGYFLGWHDNLLFLGIMMGGSVVGLMYKTEGYFRIKGWKNFWLLRIGIIIFGFLGVYLFLKESWDGFILVTVLAILFGFFNLFFIKEKQSLLPQDQSAKKKLKERLEHCCDL